MTATAVDAPPGSGAVPGAGRRPGRINWDRPALVGLRALAAGACLAASVPPWGWWPAAFVGIALLDGLLADQPWGRRFRRTWLVAAAWLFPAMLWMFDMTPPGYVIAGALAAAYFALAAALTPGGPARRWVLPGALALAELARWSWPFGGVPLAHLALGQATSPLGQLARLGGSLLVVVAVVVLGQALASLVGRRWLPAAVGAGVVVVLVVLAVAQPRADVTRTIDVALAQGGGRQRTRASTDQQPVVLAREVEASRFLDRPVDLVIWPENVVNLGDQLTEASARGLVTQVARQTGAPVVAGWFYPISPTQTVNYQSVITPDGQQLSRYDKVRLVPFGEYVPFRSFIQRFSDELPSHDVRAGTTPPVLDTPVGRIGVSISWEAFFESRARDATRNGAELLTNPTNGSSYWLTQIHTQQLASNQLRAIENDRWLVQVAPTGFSAVIDPDGHVLQRTGISERATLVGTVELRHGRTLASRVGFWPVALYGLVAVAAGLVLSRRRPGPAAGGTGRPGPT